MLAMIAFMNVNLPSMKLKVSCVNLEGASMILNIATMTLNNTCIRGSMG